LLASATLLAAPFDIQATQQLVERSSLHPCPISYHQPRPSILVVGSLGASEVAVKMMAAPLGTKSMRGCGVVTGVGSGVSG